MSDRDEKTGRLLPGHGLGVRFGSGQDMTKGGPRRSILMDLKDKGYTKTDIREAIRIIAFYTAGEIEDLLLDESLPLLARTIAGTMQEAFINKNYDMIGRLMEQVIGKAHQTAEISVSDTVSDRNTIVIKRNYETPEDAEIIE